MDTHRRKKIRIFMLFIISYCLGEMINELTPCVNYQLELVTNLCTGL